jgi:hypothetical protein
MVALPFLVCKAIALRGDFITGKTTGNFQHRNCLQSCPMMGWTSLKCEAGKTALNNQRRGIF